MRRLTRALHASAVAVPFLAVAMACVTRVDGVCDFNNACLGDPDGSSDASVDALVPPGCASGKDPKDDPNCVSDAKGVFVKAGATGGDGTRKKPFGTIGEGLAKAGGRAVFVCEGTYAESLELGGAVALYGGFDCATFAHAGKKSTLASPKALAMTAKPGAAILLQDFVVRAADGTAAGESSVALFANAAQSVQIARSELTAGTGAAGAPGEAGTPGAAGDVGKAPVGNAGGDPGVRDCGGGVSSVGGVGGAVAAGPSYTPGTDGKSTPANYNESIPGNSGAGGAAYDPGLANPAASGRAGKNGAAGTDVGAAAENDGDLSATGWTASRGKAGGAGNVGQGGGGGGAGGTDGSGGPGGGGGSGGCGGLGGAGGGAGGSSVALIAFQSAVTLTDTKLTAAAPGMGGQGGIGGQGGAGASGTGLAGGASGGGGGNGAGGNGGGGGTGGSSVGVLYKGKAPTLNGAAVSDAASAAYFTGASVTDNGGAPGDAGPLGKIGAHDGNPGLPGAKGRSGFAAAVREVK